MRRGIPFETLAVFAAPFLLAPLAQQQPVAHSIPHRPPYSPFKEFHVDQDCRLLPDPSIPIIDKKKPHLDSDPVICHLETVNHSSHMEETIVGNELHRTWVNIREQEYVVQNISPNTAVFVVHQFVPDGWVVDSDPQSTEVQGRIAIFRVFAQPGEIVRLHVGLRHASPLRTKQIG